MENTEKGEIIIKNASKAKIYVRINDVDGLAVNFNEIPHECEGKWYRVSNKNFTMQFTFSSTSSSGPTYIVSAGNTYTVGIGFVCTDSNGNRATPSYENFDEKINSSSQEGSDKKDIVIANESGKDIKVRIKTDETGGSESLWPISHGKSESWARKEGKFIAEIIDSDNNSTRYFTERDNNYTFNSDNKLVNQNGGDVEATTDSFNIPVAQPKVQTGLGVIKLTNTSKKPISARLQAKDNFGTEDVFSIDIGKVYAWKRTHGKFLIEISNDEETGQYYVETDHSYSNGDESLVDDSTSTNVDLTDYKFPTNSIKPSKKQEETKTEQKTESVEDSSEQYPYHQDIKPQFIKGSTFQDPHFPPEKHSLLGTDQSGTAVKPNFEHGEKEIMDINGMEFKRITEIFNNQFHLFQDEIEARDISQGVLGDCWLMSSIAALAQRPDLIRKIFKTRSANPEGFYELYYYHNGEKKVMFLDDHVVCKDGKPCFAKPNGEEIWVMLLEKLMAKFEGGYNNIDGGFCGDALTFLTGGVSQHYEKPGDKWHEICSAIKRGNIVTCGTFGAEGKTDKDKVDGICFGHAYSIIDAREYNGEGISFKLLKLRNPWGSGEWTGKWSDNDSSWTDEYKKHFNFTEGSKDDGLFYMELSDFAKHFEEIYICNV